MKLTFTKPDHYLFDTIIELSKELSLEFCCGFGDEREYNVYDWSKGVKDENGLITHNGQCNIIRSKNLEEIYNVLLDIQKNKA
jgi:hypothetical protein